MEPGGRHLIYLNALNRISFIGPAGLNALLKHFNDAERAWKAGSKELRQVRGFHDKAERLVKERSSVDPEQEWIRLDKTGIKCISAASTLYPPLLKELPCSPPILYYRGSLEKLLSQPAVAVVGSRRSTFYGKEVSRRLSGELASSGISVVSGMALGIDTAAHRGALEISGYTVAVLGSGLDRCYPPQNTGLMEQIVASGAVISEFPAGVKPLPYHFPRRNRIISGLSLGTVVVEATAKSGSLITANCALEQNREVFAVPGNVGSPYSRGCHQLIREGAHLVESVADILAEISIGLPAEEQLSMEQFAAILSVEEKALLELVPYQPMHIDDIISAGRGRTADTINLLLSLELKKLVRQTPGKYFCRI